MLVSPLRYPGGKAKMFDYFVEIVKSNKLFGSTYCEPYAGGAGLALRLLSTGFVDRIALNDIDESIFSFWHSVLYESTKFCALIEKTPITIGEWRKQRAIWEEKKSSSRLQLGFAAFFLNRTNRSGIIEGAGPIGGYSQSGNWKLDVRLNRAQLIKQVEFLQSFRSRISISNEDALEFSSKIFAEKNSFCYLDPPYYVKGSKLYRNAYNHEDHCRIANLLNSNRGASWVLSYDDVPQIREIYKDFKPISYSLNYSAGTKTMGQEVVYFSDILIPPKFVGFVTDKIKGAA